MQRQADAYSPEELGEVLDKYGAKSRLQNPLTKPFPFNLMFKVCMSYLVRLWWGGAEWGGAGLRRGAVPCRVMLALPVLACLSVPWDARAARFRLIVTIK